jgi:type VI protein secretion system component VasK
MVTITIHIKTSLIINSVIFIALTTLAIIWPFIPFESEILLMSIWYWIIIGLAVVSGIIVIIYTIRVINWKKETTRLEQQRAFEKMQRDRENALRSQARMSESSASETIEEL